MANPNEEINAPKPEIELLQEQTNEFIREVSRFCRYLGQTALEGNIEVLGSLQCYTVAPEGYYYEVTQKNGESIFADDGNAILKHGYSVFDTPALRTYKEAHPQPFKATTFGVEKNGHSLQMFVSGGYHWDQHSISQRIVPKTIDLLDEINLEVKPEPEFE